MNYLDLFSGCGGFRKGLEEAGFTFEWEGHSEIDKHAKKVYQTHFPKSEDLGDVRTVDPDKLPKIDLITFGFPCQDLSVAGKQAGLSGSRSGLFFEAMQIVRVARPHYFIFENVKGLFSSNEGRDWLTVLREVADSGYDGQWQLLNTRWFLPQNRERVYFVAHFRGDCRPEVFPIGENCSRTSEGTEQTPVNCLTAGGHSGGMHSSMTLLAIGDTGKNSQGARVYDSAGIATTLSAMGGGLGAKTGLYAVPVITPDRSKKRQNGRRFKEIGDPMFTLNCQDRHGVMVSPCIRSEHHNTADVHFVLEQTGIRRLTPTECARLQGFPDNWHGDVSDTQAYRMYGNAVSVPVVKAIGERLINSTGGER